MSDEWQDRHAIRQLVEDWAVWRDAGDWERFRTVWHDDGWMMATWCQASASDFIAASIDGWNKGASILHFLGGHSCDLNGNRAFSQTKMTITQRGSVHGIPVEVVCTGRFADFLEKRDGNWGIVLRQPIYEKDRIETVDPAIRLELDQDKLATMPFGYRHLAYMQLDMGWTVKLDMPQLRGPEVEALYRCGTEWLAGEALVLSGADWLADKL